MLILVSALALCPIGPRDDCIVDGDTFWLEGQKIRIADIDAPEVDGNCPYERDLALKSRNRLLDLLNAGDFAVQPEGKDRYGRVLAVVTRAGLSIGKQLIDEGLARSWKGQREPWC